MFLGFVLRFFLVLTFAILTSCSSSTPPGPLATPPPSPLSEPRAASEEPLRTARDGPVDAPTRKPELVTTTLGGILITAVIFDSRSHRLVVADQPGGPASQWPDANAAAASRNGIAAVNGGFFTPEGAPLGLVIAGGKRSGSLNRASSLGAGVFVDDGSSALVRREPIPAGRELLQSGPFLLEGGHAVPGLSPENSTARSFLGWDGGNRWFIARSGPCSLAALAKALGNGKIGGVAVRSVLNLDGGRSSDLWAGAAISGGPLHQRPFWNKPVRNFLVLIPR